MTGGVWTNTGQEDRSIALRGEMTSKARGVHNSATKILRHVVTAISPSNPNCEIPEARKPRCGMAVLQEENYDEA
jgi:hypothetical protein